MEQLIATLLANPITLGLVIVLGFVILLLGAEGLVDGYVSADKQFVSLRLYQYSQIDYQPISERHYLQGEAAAMGS